MTRILRGAILLCLAVFVSALSYAQTKTGTPPFGSFGGGPVDTVNLANLNANIRIPIISKAGRGTPFSFNLVYNSSIWYPAGWGSSQSWAHTLDYGWTVDTTAGSARLSGYTGYLSYSSYTSQPIECWPPGDLRMVSYTVYTNWQYHDPTGTVHDFPSITISSGDQGCQNLAYQYPPSQWGSATATDGSGYTLNVNADQWGAGGGITTPSGVAVIPPINAPGGASTYTDPNGNQVRSDGSGRFYDTLNNSVPVLTASGTGTPGNPVLLSYTAPSGNTASYRVNYSYYNVKTNFGCTKNGYGVSEYTQYYAGLISSITLPDNTSYTFTYEATPGYTGFTTGRLASITLPTGGTINYTYTGANNGIVCSDGSAAGLIRALSPGGTWNYTRSNPSGTHWQTVVTTPGDSQNPGGVGNDTVIDFQGIFETKRLSYQGSRSSGTLLQTTETCYNGNTTGCTETPVGSIAQITSTLQYPGGLQARTTTSYNVYGLVTQSTQTAFGNGAPGPVLKNTQITYANMGNIQDHPSVVTVQDGAGNLLSKTTYAYDEYSVNSSGITTNHTSVYGSRGNTTTVTSYYNGSSGLSTHSKYYDTGMPYQTQDANGAWTTYVYGPGSCNGAFATQVNSPISGLSSSSTWNCTGGVATSTTDANNQTSTISYTDPYFWRPASATDAASSTVNYSYSTNAAESSMTFNGGNGTSIAHSRTALDGFGRAYLSQKEQGPSSGNYDSFQTNFDIMGRAFQVSQPFAGVAGQTTSSVATTTVYDALGRPRQTTDAGNGYTSFSYSQNDVLRITGPAPSGENLKQMQHEYDALGRLASVCEITGASGAGNCGQTNSRTGFWTTYGYDYYNGYVRRTVTQNAQSGSPQTRTYLYDLLGRMVSETNPESGTTQYAYDSASGCSGSYPGDLVKKTDARGNVACFAYDSLHRMVSTTYSGPNGQNTPARYFVYDAATVNGATMANAKGRLARAYTVSSGTTTTDLGFGYSVLGAASDVYQWSQNSNGYYHVSATYWANGSVNQLSGLPGLPTLTYRLDGAGRVSTVAASNGQNLVTGTAYNTRQLPTSVTLGSGDSDSFGYDANTGRLTQFQFNVNNQTLTGDLGWNSNSTVSSLGISDPFNGANSQNCAYGYDDLRRLGSASCGGAWSQTFSYDAFGNIKKDGSSSFLVNYSSSTNRITSMSYDENGNLLNDGSHSYTWDANGRPLSIDSVAITYDALGRMAEENKNGTYTQFVYSPGGAKMGVMNGQALQAAYIGLPSGATAVYTASGLSHYRHADWLGSARLASTPNRTVYSDSAYAPFGETYAQSGSSNFSFTGMNQDTVSGLYDFPAREYSPVQGRWISPDPSGMASAHPANPQSWNRYAYAQNNPLSLIDPSGLDPSDPWTFSGWYESGGANGGGGGGGGGGLSQGGWFADATYSGPPPTAEMALDYLLHEAFADDYYKLPGFGNPSGQALTAYADVVQKQFAAIAAEIKRAREEKKLAALRAQQPAIPDDDLARTMAPHEAYGGGDDPANNGNQPSQANDNQCVSIQQNYNTAAEQNNAKWWTRFWGSVLIGGVTAGPAGALGGGGVALLNDESRSQYETITSNATQQWQAAGCTGNLKPRFP